ncbi:MAG: type I restriction-modification system subunit M N-terminal domain-containing protein, partial [Desulfobacterales bacterium]|nr:type I restriction-modification system subunit M N-terminal domain-containing protein [Desulfobacterales bacterium]
FIWSIADDCLRDTYVRGKYRDVILPMVVLRPLDSLLDVLEKFTSPYLNLTPQEKPDPAASKVVA